jgi:hypothetical protein
MILAIDSGTTNSAYVQYDESKNLIVDHGILPNPEMRQILIGREYDLVALEMIASYGMPVGASTFETCLWIGRFIEVARTESRLVYRKDIKMYLCGSMRAKDGNVRQALIDLIGEQGTKKNKGPTYGISSHSWAALAVAVYTANNRK